MFSKHSTSKYNLFINWIKRNLTVTELRHKLNNVLYLPLINITAFFRHTVLIESFQSVIDWLAKLPENFKLNRDRRDVYTTIFGTKDLWEGKDLHHATTTGIHELRISYPQDQPTEWYLISRWRSILIRICKEL